MLSRSRGEDEPDDARGYGASDTSSFIAQRPGGTAAPRTATIIAGPRGRGIL
jgi:hypothetical protein